MKIIINYHNVVAYVYVSFTEMYEPLFQEEPELDLPASDHDSITDSDTTDAPKENGNILVMTQATMDFNGSANHLPSMSTSPGL